MPERMKVTKLTQDSEDSKTLPVFREQSSGFQTIYVNNAQIALSFFDIKLLFGEVVSASDEGVKVLEKLAVYMSPEHAVAFHRVLGSQLQVYRDRFGEIRPSPESPSNPDDPRPDPKTAPRPR
jgi:hypothetical protein